MADVDDRRRDWSQLNPELLELIAGAFTELSDHFRFRSVCRSWRSSYTNLPLPRGGPWLLHLPLFHHQKEDCHVINPFDDWRSFTLRTPYSLRMKSSYVYGSTYGYFLVVDKVNGSISIANPLVSGSWFTLPIPVPTAGSHIDMHMAKIFKSDDSKVAVVVSVNYIPFLWRTGDSDWTQMYNGGHLAVDFVLYKGSFYFEGGGRVTTVLDSTTLAVTGEIAHPHIEAGENELLSYYFVESSCGELLMVAWNDDFGVWVFKLDFSEQEPNWVRVRNIGDNTLFLHFNGLVCFPAGQIGAFEKNCVYISPCGKEQVIIMNIEDDKLKSLPHIIENRILAWMIPSCWRASSTSNNGLEDLRMMLDHETAKDEI